MASRQIRPIRIEGNLAFVTLTKGYETVIDAADSTLIGRFNWCAHETRKKGEVRKVYAVRTALHEGRNLTVLMHRALMGDPMGLEIDHKDCDGLNNRRSNLRTATASDNRKNQSLSSRNTSGAKGVSWHQRAKKWSVQINTAGQKVNLGLFVQFEDAAAAYAKASQAIHGEFGRIA